ncbi:MAG: VOC family protein [Candidatus Binataceae bacterium]
MIKRLDRVDVATTDLADASRNYEHNFGFTVRRAAASADAVIAVGGAEIRLRSGTAAAATIAATGEGLAALWLEAEDVDEVAAAFAKAGIAHAPLRREQQRRILAVDVKAANQVPLFIFDRRG